ncbi:MAG: [protein-PII] uridylyltransferase [Fimbriimonadaceae bacterium]|nr:[protein-PII] uridylyltransferase [Alphaproteobacteria bacterium]
MAKVEHKKREMIDSDALRVTLTAIVSEHRGPDSALRAKILDTLKQTLADGRDLAEKWLMIDGDGTQCARCIAWLEDEIIRVLYDFTQTHIYPVRNPTAGERMAILAVGGYGRGTLAPGSDIDLLFVLPFKQTAWGESVIEYILYMLWDLGQKVGHATRTIDECIRLSKEDVTIRTSVLEARFIGGETDLFNDLQTRFDTQVVKGTGAEFIEAKLLERDLRHKRAGESRYLVEPNVKDGKGGLRDLHTLLWIAKYYYRVSTMRELVRAGVLTKAEHRSFRKCEGFLWAVRCHLHYLTGRPEERLSFDVQQEMAIRLGYTEHPGLRDVERFMKHYFLIAKEVGDLTRTLCTALELQHVKKTSALSRVIHPFRNRNRRIKDAPGFVIQADRLNVVDDNIFKDDPVNLIRMFAIADEGNVLFHPDVMRLAARSLKLINASLRKNKEANALFLDILTSGNDPEAVLRRMNESGVLGRFIPDFGRIVSLMQFNLYHHFTVDEHLLRAIGFLAEIERGEKENDHPLSHSIIRELENRTVLYVALFLHDIAKGRPEDHSIAGARVARKLCPRLGLSKAETETVSWLVENHLIMSIFAQSRDLNDPKTIRDFAEIVQSPERLKMLLILSVADIKAVGPGVWNGWKGQLLRNLYYVTKPVLDGGHDQISREELVAAAIEKFSEALAAEPYFWDAKDIEPHLERHYPAYWLNVPLPRKLVHAALIRDAARDQKILATSVSTDAFQEVTEIAVYAPDHPRLLSIIAGACAATGANIVGAAIFTTRDGMALDSIFVNKEFDRAEDEMRRGARISNSIERALKGEIQLPDALARSTIRKSKLKAFKVTPQVVITNGWSDSATVIEVNGLDRAGLLHDLTNTLSDLNLNIVSAHISTYGERAVDVFYVHDLTGQKIKDQTRLATIRATLLDRLAGPKKKPGKKRKKVETS